MKSETLFHKLCSTKTLLAAWETVRQKNSTGGIDGETIKSFQKNLVRNVGQLADELSKGKWIPQPYLTFEIPKNENEKRRLGLLSIRDKIVQQAIRQLIEPKIEKLFVGNSYGYRTGKGPVKAIRRALSECRIKSCTHALKLDIDNYFDNINHDILEGKISDLIQDTEILRLIMLCVKMGCVTKGRKWQDTEKGVPQGAVLSPILANLYLHDFDTFVLSKTPHYIRYADDFVIICKDSEEASVLKEAAGRYLQETLALTLNSPILESLETGFDFLKVHVCRQGCTLSRQKSQSLAASISAFKLSKDGLSAKDTEHWKGICGYYGQIISEEDREYLDSLLLKTIERNICSNWQSFSNHSILEKALATIPFMSHSYTLKSRGIRQSMTDLWLASKKQDKEVKNAENAKAIRMRKQEYRKLENEDAEIIITTPGTCLGIAKGNFTAKSKGRVIFKSLIKNLKHIVIMTEGVSLSSNLLGYTMKNRIPVDIFTRQGKHLGAFVPSSATQCTHWHKQAEASTEVRNTLAIKILEGKIANQFNLIKYFHKYHKSRDEGFIRFYSELEGQVNAFRTFCASADISDCGLNKALMGQEAQVALKYWNYIRAMLADDNVGFVGREQQGAKDIVNCMLNYGYSLLYSRIWNALLQYGLNPYESIIHARQPGKPTFVFDIIEIFRAQAVDRVVLSLVQKHEAVEINDGMLTDSSKTLLVQNLSERMYKRETFRKEEMTFEKIIKVQIREIASYFTEGTKFKPYKAKW